jgi:Photosynthetic reaction centre cytochrome C subunit
MVTLIPAGRLYSTGEEPDMRRVVAVCSIGLALLVGRAGAEQPPAGPLIVDTPTVTALKGLTVPEFEAEMQIMTQALGVSCGYCHVRGNFASDLNPRKATSRRMIEMTQGINRQFFPDYKGAEGESRLGKVTCFTCHQGSERPKSTSAGR